MDYEEGDKLLGKKCSPIIKLIPREESSISEFFFKISFLSGF